MTAFQIHSFGSGEVVADGSWMLSMGQNQTSVAASYFFRTHLTSASAVVEWSAGVGNLYSQILIHSNII